MKMQAVKSKTAFLHVPRFGSSALQGCIMRCNNDVAHMSHAARCSTPVIDCLGRSYHRRSFRLSSLACIVGAHQISVVERKSINRRRRRSDTVEEIGGDNPVPPASCAPIRCKFDGGSRVRIHYDARSFVRHRSVYVCDMQTSSDLAKSKNRFGNDKLSAAEYWTNIDRVKLAYVTGFDFVTWPSSSSELNDSLIIIKLKLIFNVYNKIGKRRWACVGN